MKFKYSMLAASMAMALSVAGCGGSDSDSSGEPIASGGLVITAMDGYLKNALVCSDTNENGKCEADEVLGLTNASGKLDKKVTAEKAAQVKAHPIVIKVLQPFTDYSNLKVQSGIYTVDMDHEYQAMDKDVVFRAPAGSTIASPLTDLIVAEMNNGKNQEAAEASVQKMLSGLTAEGSTAKIDLYADYLEVKDSGGSDAEKELAIKLHKTAQILTETQNNAAAAAVTNEALDKVIEDVVEKTIVAVKEADEKGKLEDPTYKPSIPVTKTESGEANVNKPVVVNYQATVVQAKLDTLENELTAHDFVAVSGFGDFTSSSINGLITDQDQTSAPVISITNTDELAKAGLAVSLENGIITISGKIDPEGASLVKAGKHLIELSADDKNSAGDKVNTVKTVVEFTVAAYNNPPQVVPAEKTEIQGKISQLDLQAKVEMSADAFDISGLFEDKDGDLLTLSVTEGSSGLTFVLSGGYLEIYGTPSAAGSFNFTITAVDIDKNEIKTTFDLPAIAEAPVANNSLADLLVGETLYRFNGDWVKADDVENNENHYHPKPDCWSLRFSSDHKIFEAESENGQCPAENADSKEIGSWAQNGENIEATFFGEGGGDPDELVALTLNEDKSGDEISRLHLNTITKETTVSVSEQGEEATSTLNVNEPMTFLVGEGAATAYWNQSETQVVVKGQLIAVDANSRVSEQYPEFEPEDTLDADLLFSMSCEELGFAANEDMPDPSGNPSYYWTEKVPYNFYLLNSDFAHDMLGADQEPLHALAFTNSDKSECGVDFDYTQETNIHPGESVVVYADPREEFSAEEFVLNTYVDRNDTVVPQESLEISNDGIYIVEFENGEGIIIHLSRDDSGKVIELQQTYNGQWVQQDPKDTNFVEYKVNGKTAYQVWSPKSNHGGAESFTIWTDGEETLKFVDAGRELCMDSDDTSCEQAGTAKIYATEDEAKQAVESMLNQELVFKGTSWNVVYGANSSENYTITFGDEILATFSKGTSETVAWEEIAAIVGLPACVSSDSCTLITFNRMVEDCDMDDDTGFDECAPEKQYRRSWSYDTEDDSITEHKVSIYNNAHESTSMWFKQ